MKNPNKYIRKAIIDRLTGNVVVNGVTLDIVGQSTFETSFPFIRVYSYATQETDFNQTSFIQEVRTHIEVVYRYPTDSGGETEADDAVNRIFELIRTRSDGYFNLSAEGFNVFTCTMENVDTFNDNEEDFTYIRKVVLISNKVQEINGN